MLKWTQWCTNSSGVEALEPLIRLSACLSVCLFVGLSLPKGVVRYSQPGRDRVTALLITSPSHRPLVGGVSDVT